jgi:hypothetical protein
LDETDLIAYFCAEYGIHESFSIYSGGLGILAGDHCKTASDLRLPFVAVGLMYRQGYFIQRIDRHGQQISRYYDQDPNDVPIRAVTGANGETLLVDCAFPGRAVLARVWRADIGRVCVYLLDTNVPENDPADRDVTQSLYGGDRALRLKQEAVLGIGGVRALRAVGLAPTIWHMNEGHAALSVLERIREHIAGGLAFDVALEAVSACTLFTTHTPVAAGHDVFPSDLVAAHFKHYVAELGIDTERLLALGHNGEAAVLKSMFVSGDRPDRLWLNVAYTFSDFRFDDDPLFGNNEIPGAPRHYLRAELLYKHPAGFYVGPNVEWVPEAYFVDSANTLDTEAYAIWGLKAGYDSGKGFSVYVEGRNLSDTHYIASTGITNVADPVLTTLFEPGTGRAVFAGVKVAR